MATLHKGDEDDDDDDNNINNNNDNNNDKMYQGLSTDLKIKVSQKSFETVTLIFLLMKSSSNF